MSSGEHSLHNASRRGSVGLLDAVGALQRLSNSDMRISNPLPSIDNRVAYHPVDARNESTSGRDMAGSLQIRGIVPGVQDPDGFVGAQHPPRITANEDLHLPSGEVDTTPLDVEGPDLPTNPRSHVGAENATTTASAFPVDSTTAPVHNPAYEGTAPPPVNTPSVPPLRRVRTRGIFIIGNGAPIKIDEGLEVHLRDGVDGQVDFII